MSIGVRVGGTWKVVNAASVRVSGAWKSVSQAYVRVSGAWAPLLNADATAVYVSTNSSIEAATKNYTGINVGSAPKLIIGLTTLGSSITHSSMTVAGNAALLLYTSAGVSFWLIDNPGGTVNITAVTSSSSHAGLVVWGATGLVNSTITNSASSVATPGSGSVGVDAGGLVFAMACPGNASGSTTWTNLTEDVDSAFATTATRNYTAARGAFATAQTVAVSAAYSASNSANRKMVAISIR